LITVNHILTLMQQLAEKTAALELKANEEKLYYSGARECVQILQQEIGKIEEELIKKAEAGRQGQGKEDAGSISESGKEQKKVRKLDSVRKARQSSRK
jgi:hypothetical protein